MLSRATSLLSTLILALAALGWASPGLAADGVLEINQTCAVQTGCFAGDTAGFPVTITQRGSYVLTGNLESGSASQAIILTSSDVTLDLGGFSIRGDGSSGPLFGVLSGASGLVVRNGLLSGFTVGVSLSGTARVENLLIHDVSGTGISIANGDGHVLNNTVFGGDAFGIKVGPNSYVANNAVMDVAGTAIDLGAGSSAHANAIANAGTDFAGAVMISTNLCDGVACAPPPRRRYYLTQQTFNGAQALAACAEGFHMASLWEIKETATLRYDTTLGLTDDDSGEGPPSAGVDGGVTGWIRTGYRAEALEDYAGRSNCVAWTSASASYHGTSAAPEAKWGQIFNVDNVYEGHSRTWGWDSNGTPTCNQAKYVWCVQDD